MTVSTINSVAEFVTNGVTKSFPFYFKFLESKDLVVTYISPEGTSSDLVMGTHYTVAGAGNENGGSVLTVSALAGPGQLIVSRDMEAYQQTSLRNQGKFLAETHEDVFDRLTMLIQQGFSIFKRALTRPFGREFFFAESRRIASVADPVELQDAATKHSVEVYVGQVLASGQGPANLAENVLYALPGHGVGTVQDLSSTSDLAKGASAVGRSTVAVLSVTDIPKVLTDRGLCIALASYRPGISALNNPGKALGSGVLHFLPKVPKSLHNGGTIFSPSCKWDGDEASLNNYLEGAGETDTAGVGCWCRLDSGSVNAQWFGATGDGITNDTKSMQGAINTLRSVYVPQGVYMVDELVFGTGSRGARFFGDGNYHYTSSFRTVVKARVLNQSSVVKILQGCDCISFENLRVDGDLKAISCFDGAHVAFLHMFNVGVYASREFGYKGIMSVSRLARVFSGGHLQMGFDIYSDTEVSACEFTGGTIPLRIKAGGNRFSGVWVNSGSECCIAIEVMDDATTHINTSMVNMYVGEVFGGDVTKPIIRIKGRAGQRVQSITLSNSHFVGAASEGKRKNYGITCDYVDSFNISNLDVLGNAPHTDDNQLSIGLWANNCTGINIQGGTWRNIATNPIVLGTAVYDTTIDGVKFRRWGNQGDAIGDYAAAIRVLDIDNYGQVQNCTFDDPSGSPHPFPMTGGASARFGFTNNFVRVNNPKIWTPTVGSFSGSYRTLSGVRTINSTLATEGALYNSSSDGAPLTLGNWHIWVDAAGRLRMKNGKPTSQDDGNVVGTQS